MKAFIVSITLLLLVGCGGSSSSPTPTDVPNPPVPPDNTTSTYTVPTGELVKWAVPVDAAGFEGSATYCDLDNDGTLEGIVPVAVVDGPELSFLMVVEGDTGAVRWQSAPGDASYAYPLCVDVNDDGVLDILTGGRTKDLIALSGVDGQPIWQFNTVNPDAALLGNTYSAAAETISPSTIFFTSGGGGGIERLVGKLFAIDLSGAIIASWIEPQNREIYTTPALYRSPTGILYLAVGSGGETLPGSIFILSYDENDKAFSVVSEIPSSCQIAGWIASPVFADVTGDGIPEVINSDYCGATLAMSLAGEVIWQANSDQLYATSNPAMADLNGDGILDVINAFASLNWSIPDSYDLAVSQVIAINGLNGEVMWKHDFNTLISSSLVTADYNGDQIADIFSINIDGLFGSLNESSLVVLDGTDGSIALTNNMSFSSGTPALGDLNGNGVLDMLYAETSALTATNGGIVLLEFPGVIPPQTNTSNSFRGMPLHNGYIP
ncbi:MAG: hypothetical protein HRT35_03220 [Algicola sp.]|nr:hypothetical protein [Algicola sp.]